MLVDDLWNHIKDFPLSAKLDIINRKRERERMKENILNLINSDVRNSDTTTNRGESIEVIYDELNELIKKEA